MYQPIVSGSDQNSNYNILLITHKNNNTGQIVVLDKPAIYLEYSILLQGDNKTKIKCVKYILTHPM